MDIILNDLIKDEININNELILYYQLPNNFFVCCLPYVAKEFVINIDQFQALLRNFNLLSNFLNIEQSNYYLISYGTFTLNNFEDFCLKFPYSYIDSKHNLYDIIPVYKKEMDIYINSKRIVDYNQLRNYAEKFWNKKNLFLIKD